MGNKGLLNTCIAVMAATLFFYGLSTFGALAFSQASTKVFGDQTYAGPFELSGYKGPEAIEKLSADFATLQGEFSVHLAYQDAVVALPVELVQFNAEQTVEQVKSGKENPLAVAVSIDGLRTVLSQQFSSLLFTEDSLQKIASGIEQELGTGIMPLTVHLTDYMDRSEFMEEEVASSSLAKQELSSSLQKLMKALDGVEIAPFSSFSLLDVIQDQHVGPISDAELTMFASVLYSTVLQTNFEVDERSIGSQLAPAVEPGFEAAINQQLGLNFKFTNPNKSAFTLRLKAIGGSMYASISGMPFLYRYEPYIGQRETYQQKTVRQFSAFVADGQVRVEDAGKEGVEVSVHRLISYEGMVVRDELISTDFYAPMPQIELHPLKKENQQSSGNVSEGAGDPQVNVPSSESVSPEDTADVQTEKRAPEAVQYDKGGNIIN